MIEETKIKLIDRYFNAANYLSVGQLYLMDNPLLKRPLTKHDIKKKIVGHWGTVPAQNFIYAHLNRLIRDKEINMIYVSGPGHGGNSLIANTYLEGTYSEIYPEITEDEGGLKKLFQRFSYPGGVPSHAAPETPGSIHEGGELGYSLAHSFGAVLDNPNLIVACVIGDGEAETGPLATSWNGVRLLNPKKDGFVLPIINLNGYKISNPTILSKMSKKEIASYFYGLGYHPYLVEDNKIFNLHTKMYNVLEKVMKDYENLRKGTESLYPLIILKTPKGWTGPKFIEGIKIEGTFKSHQIPLKMTTENDIYELENWLKSYEPGDLFDENGKLSNEIKKIIPQGLKRMGMSLYANGGKILRNLVLPDIYDYSSNFERHGSYEAEDTVELGKYLRDVYKLNSNNFRLFAPDELMSNRLYKIFDIENRAWQMSLNDNDEHMSKNGRVMDAMLSEHVCEGMLEGYLLTGRHGMFTSYEAFIRIVDSMTSQHAKWLKTASELDWRADVSSLNYLLTSHVWQQDHNGYTHQEPGFINMVADKKPEISRIYFPYDSNSLIVTVDHILRTKNKINVVTASKHSSYQWLNMKDTIEHFKRGIGIWNWASCDETPNVIIASAGDTPTVEALAATKIINEELPEVKVRYINVIDLMKLKKNHPHGLSDEIFEQLFERNIPVIFNFHGYPSLIHTLIYERKNINFSVHGYEEEGTITTPFDMRVLNKIDRYHLVIDVIEKLHLTGKGEKVKKHMENMHKKHREYIVKEGVDLPEIRNWNY